MLTDTPTLIFRHKATLVARAYEHAAADDLRQNYGYWIGGKGCAVGCLSHANDHPHFVLQADFGLPAQLNYLVDAFFEKLPMAEAKLLPQRYASAAKEGADLSNVWNLFALWLLAEFGLRKTDANCETIESVAELYRRASVGVVVTREEWRRAARAAAVSAAASSTEWAEWAAASSEWAAVSAAEAASSEWAAAEWAAAAAERWAAAEAAEATEWAAVEAAEWAAEAAEAAERASMAVAVASAVAVAVAVEWAAASVAAASVAEAEATRATSAAAYRRMAEKLIVLMGESE